MKKTKYLKAVCVLVGYILVCSTCFSQNKIISYNIRYDTQNDGENWWELRKDEVVDLLIYYSPEFIGIQEALPSQMKFIAEHLKEYKYIGHGRDGLETNSEATPIFYKSDKYELLSFNLFWLSETPEKISKGWDAALKRIVVYGEFKIKDSGEVIHVFNTHFDHVGIKARHKSAELLVDYIRENHLMNEKIILMGDFNCLPTDSPIVLLENEFQSGHNAKDLIGYGPIGTFNGFDTEKPVTKQIDYIFTRNIDIKSYRCIDDRRRNNLYPSDHFPILIEI